MVRALGPTRGIRRAARARRFKTGVRHLVGTGRCARGRSARSAMTSGAAGIGEGIAHDGHKLPIVAGRMQRELERTKGGAIPHLAVRLDGAKAVDVAAAGADDDLPNTVRGVRDVIRRDLREALVKVRVP